jgi:hypothetical protein
VALSGVDLWQFVARLSTWFTAGAVLLLVAAVMAAAGSAVSISVAIAFDGEGL